MKYYIWSLPLYGAETWTLRKVDQKYLHGFEMCCCTGYGRKKSPIWEANKFKTKEDTANVTFLFMESTQNAVLHQRVLNKTSLKWRP